MENTKFNLGMKNLNLIDGAGGQAVIDSLQSIAPDVSKYIVEFAFGDIYSREGLSIREKEIITITSLLSIGGCEKQLAVHIKASLNVGISHLKIIDTFIQCIPYVGIPRVLNAIFEAKEIFKEKNLI